MIANYHTHTWRCLHASGTEREYIENAIEGGLKILGFSDHTPMPYPGDYVSKSKMRMDQLEDYVTTVLRLKKEYEREIEIRLGLEVEYYPAYFEELLEFTGQYPVEYFLLAQHFLGNEINDFFVMDRTSDREHLLRYCEQTEEALRTGRFSCFAHPDVLNFTGDQELYRECMRRLCGTAKEMKVPLEVNFLGLWTGRHYPNPAFWEIAGEEGNEVIYGADAHQADKVWNPEALAMADKLAKDCGLRVIDTLEFRSPFVGVAEKEWSGRK